MTDFSRPRIALVGPMEPYRGGISQYTTQLHGALAGICDVRGVSFKRQYPGWLYPGKGDRETGKEDRFVPGVEYLLDACSPWSWRRAADHMANLDCDLVVINWWTIYWAPGLAYMARRLRSKGIRTALLCHNIADHGAAGLQRSISEWLVREADAYIVHTGDQARRLREMNPGSPVLHRLHPIYGQFPAPPSPPPKRGRLELLFFGFIRPYKGLEVLLQALHRLQDQDVYLSVVGETWGSADSVRDEIKRLGVPNVDLHLEYVDPATAANYFARADIVVLPYLSATGSGVVALAYNYRKPVLGSSVGGLCDSVVEAQTGWLVPPGSPDHLASAIASLGRDKAEAMTDSIDAFCREHTWRGMAEAICDLSRSLHKTDPAVTSGNS